MVTDLVGFSFALFLLMAIEWRLLQLITTVSELQLVNISMLGIIIGCNDKSAVEDDYTVYTLDFGGGLLDYQLETAQLIYALGTTVNASFSGSTKR